MSSEQRKNLARARAVLDKKLEDGADADKLGANLFAASDLMRANPNLLNALTDAGRSGKDRQALVRHVFDSHLCEPAIDITEFAAAEHWSRPRALAATIGELGLDAHVDAARDTIGVEALCQQLIDVIGVLADNRELRVDLSELGVGSAEQRADLAAKIFTGHCDKETVALVHRAVFTTSYGELMQKLRKYANRAAELVGKTLVVATTAEPLDETQKRRLTYLASKRWDRPVLMTWAQDSELIGGFRLDMGAEAMDTSVRTDLTEAKLLLTS